MKTCSRCSTSKPLNQMAKQKGSPDGRSSWCKQCYRDVNRQPSLERLRQQRVKLDALKDAPCGDCQTPYPPCCMDFDHVRGSKTKQVGRLYGYRDSRVLEEIAKCDLVCAVCHRLRTDARRSPASNPRYVAFQIRLASLKTGCPCVDCGRCFPAAAMDFDHVRGSKYLSIAKMYTSSWERVLVEVAKCELVCANCHRIRTQARKTREAA